MRAGLAVVSLLMLPAVVAEAQLAPLDVVGIRTGMPFDSALSRITEHNPALRKNPPYRGPLPNGDGVPVNYGYLTRVLNQPEILNEEVAFDAALPPSKSVVTSIRRTVTYRPAARPAYSVMLEALRKKYGTHDFTDGSGTHFWHYDVAGKPRRVNNRCDIPLGNRAHPDRVANVGMVNVALHDAAAIDAVAAGCGRHVRAELLRDTMNPELVTVFTIVADDAPLRAAAHRSTVDHLAKIAAQRKQQETDAAKKQSPKI